MPDLNMNNEFISIIPWSFIFSFPFTNRSLFREYQSEFLKRHGPKFSGRVIEVGGERHYQNIRFFPNASEFICANIARDFDQYLDITDMRDTPNESQDGYVCVSVLEHIPAFERGILEMDRTLKVGGHLIVTVPFAYPYHDVVDYWRFSRDAYVYLFQNYEIKSLTRFGGTFSTIVSALQRPRGRINRRYIFYKLAGMTMAVMGKMLDQPDAFPLGYGIYAVKTSSNKAT